MIWVDRRNNENKPNRGGERMENYCLTNEAISWIPKSSLYDEVVTKVTSCFFRSSHLKSRPVSVSVDRFSSEPSVPMSAAERDLLISPISFSRLFRMTFSVLARERSCLWQAIRIGA